MFLFYAAAVRRGGERMCAHTFCFQIEGMVWVLLLDKGQHAHILDFINPCKYSL